MPKSYLKAWCDPDVPARHEPYVWRFSKDGGTGQRKSPGKIFAETDFYTIHLPGGERDLSLEHGLATVEAEFCELREARIARRQTLNTTEKAWFCAFIAAMHIRTRPQRNVLRQQWGHALRVAEDLQRSLTDMTPEERLNYRPPTSLTETTGRSLTIDDVQELAQNPIQHMLPSVIEEELPILVQMNLTFFTTQDDTGFITSDHPCIWFDPDGGPAPPLLRSRTVEVSMPVSPNSLALLSWQDFPPYREATLPEVDNANRSQRIACSEYCIVRRNVNNCIWST